MLSEIKNAKFICTHEKMGERDTAAFATSFNSKSTPYDFDRGTASFRKTVELPEKPESAVVTVTALGIFDLFINGKRVGETKNDGSVVFDEYKPGWTDYHKRVIAYTYNVASYLEKGANTFYAVVSSGWWTGRISFGVYGRLDCAFILAGEAKCGGKTVRFSTDGSWEGAILGPVMFGDIWDGEFYDARISYGDVMASEKWMPADIFEGFEGEISDHTEPPIREKTQLARRPVSAVCYSGTKDNGTDHGEINVLYRKIGDGCEDTSLMPGQTLLLDFAQNMVGRPAFRVIAERGTRITLYFAELLNDSGEDSRGNDGPAGSAYVKNYRSAKSRVVYIASGEKDGEYFFPTHSFYGFRYIEAESSKPCEILSVTGQVIGSEYRETSSFTTSDREINKLFENIVWGQRGNYFSIATDCPQRDERLGWTGDTQIFSEAALYNGDVGSFLRKWLRDLRDSQLDSGAYTDVAPFCVAGAGNAAWGDAGIIVPYNVYRVYGDKAVLEECFESMEKYMDFVGSRGMEGHEARYGDWLAYEPTSKKNIILCLWANDADIMEKVSRVLEKEEKAEKYAKLLSDIKAEYARLFIENGEIREKSQTAYILALAYNMAPKDVLEKAAASLREKIKGNGYRLSTGFIGTGLINATLSRYGMSDLAYSLLCQTEDPSWLYSVRQGATTVWERWNSYTKKSGFGDMGMNSFNHYAYGAVCAWMFSYMAGIACDDDAPGFRSFVYRPVPDMRDPSALPDGQKRIDFVKASYDSPAGTISSAWTRTDSGFIYTLSVPEGATAHCRITAPSADKVTVNGFAVSDCAEISGCDAGCVGFDLTAGKYEIITENE